MDRAGSGEPPCPGGREPLLPRQDIHVLTRARAIHGALDATPGRQDTARLDASIGASIANQRSNGNESPKRRPGRGMRKAGHGWPAAASQAWMPAEPGSMPRSGRRCVRSPRADRPLAGGELGV